MVVHSAGTCQPEKRVFNYGQFYAATVMLDLSMVVIPMGSDACPGKQGEKMAEGICTHQLSKVKTSD